MGPTVRPNSDLWPAPKSRVIYHHCTRRFGRSIPCRQTRGKRGITVRPVTQLPYGSHCIHSQTFLFLSQHFLPCLFSAGPANLHSLFGHQAQLIRRREVRHLITYHGHLNRVRLLPGLPTKSLFGYQAQLVRRREILYLITYHGHLDRVRLLPGLLTWRVHCSVIKPSVGEKTLLL